MSRVVGGVGWRADGLGWERVGLEVWLMALLSLVRSLCIWRREDGEVLGEVLRELGGGLFDRWVTWLRFWSI